MNYIQKVEVLDTVRGFPGRNLSADSASDTEITPTLSKESRCRVEVGPSTFIARTLRKNVHGQISLMVSWLSRDIRVESKQAIGREMDGAITAFVADGANCMQKSGFGQFS